MRKRKFSKGLSAKEVRQLLFKRFCIRGYGYAFKRWQSKSQFLCVSNQMHPDVWPCWDVVKYEDAYKQSILHGFGVPHV